MPSVITLLYAPAPTIHINLLFHRVTDNNPEQWDITPAKFRSITEKYLEHYKPLNPEDFEESFEKLPEEPDWRQLKEWRNLRKSRVMFMFDDASKEQKEAIKWLYETHKIKSTLFVVLDWIGKDNFMPIEDILDLQNNYGTRIELHGKRHDSNPELLKAGVNLGEELEAARQDLSKMIGKEVSWYAYPYGHHNDAVIEEIKSKTSFERAFTVESFSVDTNQDPMQTPRIMYLENEKGFSGTFALWQRPPTYLFIGLFALTSTLPFFIALLMFRRMDKKVHKKKKQNGL